MARPAAQPKPTPGVLGLAKSKKGPFPIWVWALFLVGGLVVVLYVRSRMSSSTAASDTSTGSSTDPTAPNLNQSPIFIVPQAPVPSITVTPAPSGGDVHKTHPQAPAGGGRPSPPATTPPPAPPSAPPAAATPPPSSGGASGAATPTPAGLWVPFVAFGNPAPWNSTVWGVWNHYKTTENIPAADWQAVWNDSANAPLRTKRGTPQNVQPKDQIFVRGAH